MAFRTILLAAFLALLGVAAPIVSTNHAAASEPPVVAGMRVSAARSTPLRTSPPEEGLFYAGKGRTLAEIQTGEVFEVGQVVRIRKPLGDEVWLYLKRMGGMGGWAYAGPAGSAWVNFRTLEPPR